MAIQGTQVPMYTNIHSFYIFLIFHFFNMKKKINKIENMLNKTKYKTRLTQSSKAKHKSNANKNIEGERNSD